MATVLWQVSDEQLDQFIDSPELVDRFLTDSWDQGSLRDKSIDVDKSIEGIQSLLDGAEVPVYLAPTEMPGEPIESVGSEIYFGFGADFVKQIAENLRSNSFDVLARHFDVEQMNRAGLYPATWGADDLDYLREHYDRLVQFFDRAATANAAVLLTTG
jgi:hypothetical protein